MREVQSAVKKTKAWNSGQLTGLERTQTNLEDDLEASILVNHLLVLCCVVAAHELSPAAWGLT